MLVGHQKQWDFLKNKLDLNNLSHAYIFSGENQLGKKTFAKEFVKLINCQGKDKPCQKCINCQMIEKNNFPELMILSSEDSGEIPIAKAREALNFLSYKSYYGSFKTVIVDDADKMNSEAQSCFLKTLEEPKGKTLLFLISSKPEILLSTIHSRCQNIKFFPLKQEVLVNSLLEQGADKKKAEMISSLSSGSFGLAQEMFSNPEKIKEQEDILHGILKIVNADLSEKFKYVKSLELEGNKLRKILEVLQRYLRYQLFVKSGIGETRDQKYMIKSTVLDDYTVEKLKKAIKLIEDINFQILFTNASPKLALEVLLMEI